MMGVRTRSRQAIRTGKGDRLFLGLVYVGMVFVLVIVLFPLIHVVSSSFSSAEAILSGKVVLWPVNLSVDGYRAVFRYRSVLTGYQNSIIYTVVGTILNVMLTLFCAYPLARKNLPFKGAIMFLFTFTMYFGGGMIPSYILMRQLSLIDTMGAVILPGAIAVYNMIITRTFIQTTIPEEMLEASRVDGCSDARFFFQMVLPLSKAIIAVIALYYAVGHWNSWFDAFIYLNSRERYPLQLILREILISNQFDTNEMIMDLEARRKMQGMSDLMKYSLIVISSVPVMCIYPFVQKYFVRGVMIGSLKG